MGVVTGQVKLRGQDYVGLALNRAARVMAAGHGGQILVSKKTSSLIPDVELEDLGEHRLRDLSGTERLFQVHADGLAREFPKLRTVNAVPVNLSMQATSFVGRDAEVKEIKELVRQHRLVTLSGVGGVGKTRLAVHVAEELAPDFDDGVWLIELAPVGDPAALAEVVASTLGVNPQPGRSVAASVGDALRDRRMLIVLDNCEHLLDAATDLIETVLKATTAVALIATSREGLGLGGEHLWVVPSLGISGAENSAAVELFVERAKAVKPGFNLNGRAEIDAVIEICRRLDGIALAIELAAARMVSMTPVEVSARLNDRFRLLSGSRRSLGRHQTLGHAVQWSYDLLTPQEQSVLGACAVFAGGFDLAAVTAVCDDADEYAILDGLESLVRKSLVSAKQAGDRTRYGLLETIRHFAEDQRTSAASEDSTATVTAIGEIRARHARHYAEQAIACFDIWDGPRMGEATAWLEAEFDNLRAGFRWASDLGDLETATAIAAHTPIIAFAVQRLEPVGWAEELLPAATAARVKQLPRLYSAASLCTYLGRHEDALGYAKEASAMQTTAEFQPFDQAWVKFREAVAELDSDRADRYIEICTDLAALGGRSQVVGLCGLAAFLPSTGRTDEAMAIAAQTMTAAISHGHPYWIAFAHVGYGRAFAQADPARALEVLRDGLTYVREEHPIPYWESVLAREAGGLEAVHGDPEQAFDLLSTCLDAFHQAGNTATLGWTLASLAVLFERVGQPEPSATIHGTTTRYPIDDFILGLASAIDNVRATLDPTAFDACVRAGAAMNLTEAVHYAHHHIGAARLQLLDQNDRPS